MDFIRPLLLPLLVTAIVSTIWCLAWMKQMDAEAVKASRPAAIAVFASAGTDSPDFDQP